MHVVDRAGETVWRKPLGDRVSVQKRAVDAFGRRAQNPVKMCIRDSPDTHNHGGVSIGVWPRTQGARGEATGGRALLPTPRPRGRLRRTRKGRPGQPRRLPDPPRVGTCLRAAASRAVCFSGDEPGSPLQIIGPPTSLPGAAAGRECCGKPRLARRARRLRAQPSFSSISS